MTDKELEEFRFQVATILQLEDDGWFSLIQRPDCLFDGNQGNAAAFDDDSVPCPIMIIDDQMFMIVIGLPNLEINIHQIIKFDHKTWH